MVATNPMRSAMAVLSLILRLIQSLLRAIRWASDRVGDAGVVGFVTNAGFLDANFADGLRKCLASEFSNIYVFHLRGNQYTSGELSRREGGKIFDSGSRAPIAISILVKSPRRDEQGKIFFHDIGDYLSRKEKLENIAAHGSIEGISSWSAIVPDEYGDWLEQRDESFSQYMPVSSKVKTDSAIFSVTSQGLITARDGWCYNASADSLAENIEGFVCSYNGEVDRFDDKFKGLQKKARDAQVDAFIELDSKKFNWSRSLKSRLAKGEKLSYARDNIVPALYRPFSKQMIYFDSDLIEMISRNRVIFPRGSGENRVICFSGPGCISGFSALITSIPADFCVAAMKGGTPCLPLFVYEAPLQFGAPGKLFDDPALEPNRSHGISDLGLAHYQAAYSGEEISKEDLFYYVYGLFHSPDYRERFADNLSKELPRIPAVKQAADFWAFSKAGRALAELHLNYETVEQYPLTIEAKGKLTDADYRVEKMKFAKKKDPETGKSVNDRRTVIYNGKITLKDIPEAAWDYVVNGKAALDWVMERQAVRTDKASGIVNDANDWATETMGNPKYPLELFQRVVTVSLETQKIVNSLPPLDI
ncbi:MAG: hypothetical protein JKY78_12130 [Hyphomonas sp.]|nr:hypothetical protein [Hyphomonas sp.]